MQILNENCVAQFMKRKEEAQRVAKAEEEMVKQIKEAHWVARENVGALSLEERKVVLPNRTGRRSFQKFNPYIEKLTNEKVEGTSDKVKVVTPDKGTVPEEEMAERYQTLIGKSPYGKPRNHTTKKEESQSHQNKKRKFDKE